MQFASPTPPLYEPLQSFYTFWYLCDYITDHIKLRRANQMIVPSVKPLFSILIVALSLLLAVILLSPRSPLSEPPVSAITPRLGKSDIWSVPRIMEWRPCKWWLEGDLTGFLFSFLIFPMLPVTSCWVSQTLVRKWGLRNMFNDVYEVTS